jgi:hypothetical protein
MHLTTYDWRKATEERDSADLYNKCRPDLNEEKDRLRKREDGKKKIW